MCKIGDAQLVSDFSVQNRGPIPVNIFLKQIPIYARVGNLEPFARTHILRTILAWNVVLGPIVECWNMSSVAGACTHTHTHKGYQPIPTNQTIFLLSHSQPQSAIKPRQRLIDR